MPKYLATGNFTLGEGFKGLIADGGTARVKAVQDLMASVGGKVEAFYYAIGDVDDYVILEVPDEASAIAAAFTVKAAGLVEVTLIKLIEPSEIDEAVKKSPLYDPPGPTA